MYTPGPAMSFLTCFWLFPQNEHLSRSPPSPMRATRLSPLRGAVRRRGLCYPDSAWLMALDVHIDGTASEALGQPPPENCGGEAGGPPDSPAAFRTTLPPPGASC